jgi:ABC-type nickel/cobalt efflux system permease component RcnA
VVCVSGPLVLLTWWTGEYTRAHKQKHTHTRTHTHTETSKHTHTHAHTHTHTYTSSVTTVWCVYPAHARS